MTDLSASHLLSIAPWVLVVVLVLVLWSVLSWVYRLFVTESRHPLLVAFVLWLLDRHRR